MHVYFGIKRNSFLLYSRLFPPPCRRRRRREFDRRQLDALRFSRTLPFPKLGKVKVENRIDIIIIPFHSTVFFFVVARVTRAFLVFARVEKAFLLLLFLFFFFFFSTTIKDFVLLSRPSTRFQQRPRRHVLPVLVAYHSLVLHHSF